MSFFPPKLPEFGYSLTGVENLLSALLFTASSNRLIFIPNKNNSSQKVSTIRNLTVVLVRVSFARVLAEHFLLMLPDSLGNSVIIF